jgi:uncharacterized protein YvpB
MRVLWKGLQVTLGFFLIGGLLFASAVFSILLYAKITGQAWFDQSSSIAYAETAGGKTVTKASTAASVTQPPATPQPTSSVMLEAPVVKQKPELPSGCEVTTLTMLLQFYGLAKDKMELAAEMKRDTTPIKRNADGSIAYWGNPNLGFVGDVTGASKGFGIYHTALLDLLHKYIPKAVDLTLQPWDKLELQLGEGIPSLVWTTIDYQVPDKWVVWDTPIGPIQTTFMEHAVLLVGFDEQYVYVNDPLSGRSQVKIDKAQFISTWEAMGRQALSYTK